LVRLCRVVPFSLARSQLSTFSILARSQHHGVAICVGRAAADLARPQRRHPSREKKITCGGGGGSSSDDDDGGPFAEFPTTPFGIAGLEAMVEQLSPFGTGWANRPEPVSR